MNNEEWVENLDHWNVWVAYHLFDNIILSYSFFYINPKNHQKT